eukprot:547093-Prymnesium_polylepis.2
MGNLLLLKRGTKGEWASEGAHASARRTRPDQAQNAARGEHSQAPLMKTMLPMRWMSSSMMT